MCWSVIFEADAATLRVVAVVEACWCWVGDIVAVVVDDVVWTDVFELHVYTGEGEKEAFEVGKLAYNFVL